MSSDIINEFKILKAFLVDLYPRSPYLIIQVDWIPPPLRRWIKGNTYGSAKSAPGPAACGGIFRDQNAATLGCFSVNVGNSSC